MSTSTLSPDMLPKAAKVRRKLPPSMYFAIAIGLLVLVSIIRLWTGANNLTSTGAIQSALTAAVPIALAGLAGLWSERAGVVNIGLEGMMVLGTLGAGFAGYQWGPYAAAVFGILLGLLGGLLHGLATITFGVDHIISGVAINLVAPGLSLYLSKLLFTNAPGGGQKQSPPIADAYRITIKPLSDGLKTLEDKGWFLLSDLAGVIRGLTTDLSVLALFAVFLVFVTYWVLWKTRFGLRLRSVGEAPYAAESLGVNVIRYKYAAVAMSGAFAGLAGAFLAIGLRFQDGQTGGRGYIGLASLLFGNYRPGGVVMGASLFGFTDGVQKYDSNGLAMHALLILIALALAGVAVFQILKGHVIVGAVAGVLAALCALWFATTDVLPGELVKSAPYVVTLLVMGLASQRLRVPKADGLIYRKGGH